MNLPAKELGVGATRPRGRQVRAVTEPPIVREPYYEPRLSGNGSRFNSRCYSATTKLLLQTDNHTRGSASAVPRSGASLRATMTLARL